ncbi:ELWxxDGT repeat protein [Foetidibacter luteolus]|uniref:ELWxxDGT repeat protein n=1 Tax=Foetidibacter luteolus TaxID=2608880 RepID=UPI00129A62DC|nr:ELWxxDGT repeat protein [Foetidibacter luteolus]
MRFSPNIKPFLAILLVLCLCKKNFSQNFHLVKDIDSITNSNPNVTKDCILNNVCYFSADNGANGTELWRSDGTTEGTYMVKDINPGLTSSGPRNIVVYKNKIYFLAAATSYKLWVSDGTADGTKIYEEINDPSYLTVSNNFLFFVAQGKLWKTDGSENGLSLVFDFTQISFQGVQLTKLCTANNKLFFAVSSYDNTTFQFSEKLWASNGTSTGTYSVSDSALEPSQIIGVANNLIYFSARTANDYNRKLWVTNGTRGSAKKVASAIGINIYNLNFIAINKVLYFIGAASPSQYNTTLYKHDEQNGTIQVKQFSPSGPPDFTGIASFTNFKNSIFFSYRDSTNPYYLGTLWKSNGTTEGTFMIKDSCRPSNFCKVGSTLFFSDYNSKMELTLWKTDGTNTGTTIVEKGMGKEIAQSPLDLTPVNDQLLLFSATSDKGNELWKTDGAFTQTTLVKDINSYASESSVPTSLKALDGKIFLIASSRLWVTDGTSNATKSIPGPFAFNAVPGALSILNNEVYFSGMDSTTGHSGFFKVNAASSCELVKDMFDAKQSIKWIYATDSLVFFAAQNFFNKYSLWRSDGTVSGTFEIATGLYALPFTNTRNRIRVIPTKIGGSLFFVQQTTSNHSYELWVTDGSIEGTRKIKEMLAFYLETASYANNIYFIVNGIAGNELWKTDGTDEKTLMVASKVNDIANLTASGEWLYFKGTDESGSELWKTDGTDAGTKLVKNINTKSSKNSDPANLTDIAGWLYFFADDGIHGNELWKTNGVEDSTKLVKDISAGPESTSLYLTNWQSTLALATNITNVNGKLLMVINNHLWTSDGTDSGTHIIEDAGLSDVSEFYHLTALREQLFFTAYTHQHGIEIYAGHIEPSYIPKYTFTGYGNFDNTRNWINGMLPPVTIPPGVEILIDPPTGKECILNVPLKIKGGKLTIKPNAKITVRGNVLIH